MRLIIISVATAMICAFSSNLAALDDVSPEPGRPVGSTAGGMWLENTARRDGTLLIGYGGYGADLSGARNWIQSIAAKRGWGMMAAFKGPKDVDYRGHEMRAENERLLLSIIPSLNPDRIIIAAHSSGGYAAREFISLLVSNGHTALLARISYYNLDGGSCGQCEALAPVHRGFIYRCVAAGQYNGVNSHNIGSMQACGAAFYRKIPVYTAQCPAIPANLSWCVHGWLINKNVADFPPISFPNVANYYNDPDIAPSTEFLDLK